ncbi:Cation efflux system protein CusA [Planctomycetes bacterium Pan216]|uniref:Cation efflux system protein CusA n=2 Tax=Kolteria novifilia TaxID=2527975 RepID=A0A518B7T2_9BACT|nr:Cation efflux system protein CusA [Planctomycetes bacterium Pan216]
MVILATIALIAAGIYSIFHIRLNAIPNLGDVQVIVFTEYPGQSPQVVEDQVTYPLTTTMLSVPKASEVRGSSFFGRSFVTINFEDGTDLYWARSRVLEYLNFAADQIPPGLSPRLGPDATGNGWVYEYVVTSGYYCEDHPRGMYHDPKGDKWYALPNEAPVDARSRLELVKIFDEPGASPLTGKPLVAPKTDLGMLRTVQDWYLRYPLSATPGVSQVASLGGYVKEYQVEIDPDRLLAFDLSLRKVRTAIEESNLDEGGSVVEFSESQYFVVGRGYLGGGRSTPGTSQQVLADLGAIAIGTQQDGSPIFLRDIARIQIGPALRRGIAEWNGKGQVVAAVVLMRYQENAYAVIQSVKEKLDQLRVGLPPGVDVKTSYDRSALIERAVATLQRKLIEEVTVVAIIIMIFLLHFRSSVVAIFVLPMGVLGSLLIMQIIGVDANIMSLGGLALAIGVMVDSAIVMIENSHKRLEEDTGRLSHDESIALAAKEVGPQIFFSLLVIAVAFLPIFFLPGESGKLFRPLAYTKTFAMASAAILSITIVPILMVYLVRGRIPKEETNPINRFLIRVYEPVFWFCMRWRWLTVALALLMVASIVYPYRKLGSEFMPPLNEGTLLYMPTTDPSISIDKLREYLQQTDKLFAQFPEIAWVFGKGGRFDTATDNAPISMIGTTLELEVDESKWRKRYIDRWFSGLPDVLKTPLAYFWPEERPITVKELIYGWEDLSGARIQGLNDVANLPGLSNAWTMPIKARVEMLATGIKTPVGIKVLGSDLRVIGDVAEKIASQLRTLPEVKSVYAEKTQGGYFLDFLIDREAAARYGLTIQEIQEIIQVAMGGLPITTTVEGLERYPVNLRYPRELRDNMPALKASLVTLPSGAQIPIEELAEIRYTTGPPVVRSEQSEPTAWIYVDMTSSDMGGFVAKAKALVQRNVIDQPDFPAGYRLIWTGEYKNLEEANQRMVTIIPVTLLIIFMLLYISNGSIFRTVTVLAAIPFSLVGAFWLLYFLEFQMSVAVWVGMIALAGLDAETGSLMLLYLDRSFDTYRERGMFKSLKDLERCIHEGAVRRIRPETMTVVAAFIGLMPLMYGTEVGSEAMKRLAAPMVGGLVTSFLMELMVYPVIFFLYKSFEVRRIIRKQREAEEA